MIYRFSDLPICHLPQFLTCGRPFTWAATSWGWFIGRAMQWQPGVSKVLSSKKWGKGRQNSTLKSAMATQGVVSFPDPLVTLFWFGNLATRGAASQGPRHTPTGDDFLKSDGERVESRQKASELFFGWFSPLYVLDFKKRETAMLSCPIVLWAQAAKELKILKIYLWAHPYVICMA